MKATLQLILGGMMSGKTTELIRRAERYILQKKNVLMVKYVNDTRYSLDSITTHKGTQMRAVPVTSMNELFDRYKDQLQAADVVCVDEGQFIQDLELCDQIVSEYGKICIVAGLDADFLRRPFLNMIRLVPLAENITKLTSVCAFCFGDGSFSYRIDQKNNTQELIGGGDQYKAICRQCFDYQQTSCQ